MSLAIVTGCNDLWRPIAAITWPRMKAYAGRIGVDFLPCHRVALFHRPEPWMKLVYIADALTTHDEVLWIDADVLVSQACRESVFDCVPSGAAQAMAKIGDPPHYNTGVWLVRRDMIPALMLAAMSDQYIHHQWWEQAAVHEITEQQKIPTHTLDESWNCWSGSPDSVIPKFRHACGMPDRLRVIQEWASDPDFTMV